MENAVSQKAGWGWRVLAVAAVVLEMATLTLQAGQPGPRQPDLSQLTLRRANPITYVTKDDPPFLIVHGDKDPLVPRNQSEILCDALKKSGVEAALYTVQGGGPGGFQDPQVDVLMGEFFDKHLRKRLPASQDR
jgi:acetyl esterase/lipase